VCQRWRDFCKSCGNGQAENLFDKRIKLKLGSEEKSRFWEDVWIRDQSLGNLFPNLVSSYAKLVRERG